MALCQKTNAAAFSHKRWIEEPRLKLLHGWQKGPFRPFRHLKVIHRQPQPGSMLGYSTATLPELMIQDCQTFSKNRDGTGSTRKATGGPGSKQFETRHHVWLHEKMPFDCCLAPLQYMMYKPCDTFETCCFFLDSCLSV